MELSEKLKTKIKKIDGLLKFLWVGQFVSFGLYVFITYSSSEKRVESINNEINYGLTIIISVISLTSCILSYVFRHYTLSPYAVSGVLEGKIPKLLMMGIKNSYHEEKERNVKDISDKEARLFWYLSNFLNLQAMHWGIIHTCAVLGLMVSMINRIPQLIFPFITLPSIILLSQFPRLKKLISAGMKWDEMDYDSGQYLK